MSCLSELVACSNPEAGHDPTFHRIPTHHFFMRLPLSLPIWNAWSYLSVLTAATSAYPGDETRARSRHSYHTAAGLTQIRVGGGHFLCSSTGRHLIGQQGSVVCDKVLPSQPTKALPSQSDTRANCVSPCGATGCSPGLQDSKSHNALCLSSGQLGPDSSGLALGMHRNQPVTHQVTIFLK